MAYEKPMIVDYGTITEHTFVLQEGKSFGFDDFLFEEEDTVSP